MLALLACTDRAPEGPFDDSERLVRFDGELPRSILFVVMDTFRRDHLP